MALIDYEIRLSSVPINSGPTYNVYYSFDCTLYVLAGEVILPTTESRGYVQVDDAFTCIKVESVGNCNNYVVSGSLPETSSYNTKLVELTEKGTTGPNYSLEYSDGGVYTPMSDIVLDNIGSKVSIDFPLVADGMKLTSQGVCDTEVSKSFE